MLNYTTHNISSFRCTHSTWAGALLDSRQITIDEPATVLEYAHSPYHSNLTDDEADISEQSLPYNHVLRTHASAKSQGQAGPAAAALFYKPDKNPAAAWQELSFEMLGQQRLHQAELFAVLYALRVALRSYREKLMSKQVEVKTEKRNSIHQETPRMEPQNNGILYPGVIQGMGIMQIMSDCKGALVAIRQRLLQHLTCLVKLSLSEIEKCGFEVNLRWVPGHQVVGNKMADMLAGRT